MNKKINCVYNDRGAWCKNKNIKRSLFGIGARCCIEYCDDGYCFDYKFEYSSLKNPSPTPKLHNGAILVNKKELEKLLDKIKKYLFVTYHLDPCPGTADELIEAEKKMREYLK